MFFVVFFVVTVAVTNVDATVDASVVAASGSGGSVVACAYSALSAEAR